MNIFRKKRYQVVPIIDEEQIKRLEKISFLRMQSEQNDSDYRLGWIDETEWKRRNVTLLNEIQALASEWNIKQFNEMMGHPLEQLENLF